MRKRQTRALIRTLVRLALAITVLGAAALLLAGLEAMHPVAIAIAFLLAPLLTLAALRIPARR